MSRNKYLFIVGIILFMFSVAAGIALLNRGQTVTETFTVRYASIPITDYKIIPTFTIVEVVKDVSVTIRTHNFPADRDFVVTMGAMYTQGIGGIVVDSFSSEAGGTSERTFAIPESLKGSYRISIRVQEPTANPYYSFNWFYNNTTGSYSVDHTPTVPPINTTEPDDTPQRGWAFPKPFPDLIVVAEWPRRLEVDGSSDSVKVWLTSKVYPDLTESPPDRSIQMATPNSPLDATPGAALPFAYGPQYTACAVGKLTTDSTSINITQDNSCKGSSLESTDRDWASWFIPVAGLKIGKHPIRAEIIMHWEPDKNIDENIRDQADFVIWEHETMIQVWEPLVTRGQLTITSIFSGFLGTFLSAPFLLGIYKEKKKEKSPRPFDNAFMISPNHNSENQVKLHRILDQYFNDQELRQLCFEMSVQYDDLPYPGQSNKARELVALCVRTGRVDELIQRVKDARPNLDFEFGESGSANGNG